MGNAKAMPGKEQAKDRKITGYAMNLQMQTRSRTGECKARAGKDKAMKKAGSDTKSTEHAQATGLDTDKANQGQ